MVNKIIFFRYLPLTQKVKEDFYFDELRQAGFIVNYWYFPFIVKVPEGVETIDDIGNVTINSYKDFKKKIESENIDRSLFISIVTYEYRVMRLFCILTQYNCKLAVFRRNAIHVAALTKTEKLSHFTFDKLFNYFKNKIATEAKRFGFVKSYDYIFCAGENSKEGLGHFSSYERESNRFFKVNSNDYDKALLIKDGRRIIEEQFIVFLDECLPLHPDLKLLGLNSVDPNIYYSQLNTFFSKIEKEFDMPVIIAAHPKSLIYYEKDYFEGRRVLFGKTAELVRDSKLVLAHDSTSIIFVVVYKKPMISLTSSDIEKNQADIHHSTLSLSRNLNSLFVYLDKDSIQKHTINVDGIKYDRFKYSFLTSKETEYKKTSDLLINYLKVL